MKNSIKEELQGHILDCINDGIIDNDNQQEWHFHCFNEDYYIIGYYEASQWLERHNLNTFEAIDTCIQYEKDNFGECNKSYDNAETTVNMLAYIYGGEILSEIQAETIEELEEAVS